MSKKISELSSAALPLSGHESVVMNQNGSTVISPLSTVKTYLEPDNSYPIIRTQADGYPTTTNRRRVVLPSGDALSGDISGCLLYEIGTDSYTNPVAQDTWDFYDSDYTATLAINGGKYELTIQKDGVTTGQWHSMPDHPSGINSLMYGVGGSGIDTINNPVVKTISISATELTPDYIGQFCIVGNEVFISRSLTGNWGKLPSFSL